jgi:5-keto 4-deoxyuronate isomerase
VFQWGAVVVCEFVLAVSSFANCTGVSAAWQVAVNKMNDRQLDRRKLFIINIINDQSCAYIEGDAFKMQHQKVLCVSTDV